MNQQAYTISNTVFSSSQIRNYTYFDNAQRIGYNRRAIDGRIVGCGKCVGYCQYREHPGFLTESLRKEHDCLNKQCDYYLSKPSPSRSSVKKINPLELVASYASQFEGLKIIRAESDNSNTWICYYITITNSYSEDEIESILFRQTEHSVKLIRLNYDFDVCAELILNA